MSPASHMISRSGLDTLFEGHPDAIYVFDISGNFVQCNERLVDLTGYPRSELVKTTFDRIVHPDDLARVREQFSAAAAGEHRSYRTRGATKSGDLFVVDVTNIPLRDESGEVVAVIGIAKDVGAFEDMVRRTDLNEGILRIAGRLAKLSGWSIDVATGEVSSSDELDHTLGLSPDAARHYTSIVAMHPEPHRTVIQMAVERCMETGEPIDVTSIILDSNHQELQVRTVGEAVHDENGRVIRIQGAFYDIGDIVAAEQGKLRSDVLLQETLDQMATGICFLDKEWRFTFANKTAERFIRNPTEKLLGNSVWDLYPEVVGSNFDSAYRRAMDEGEVSSARGYYAPLEKWFEATAYPIKDGIALHLNDVSEDQELRLQLEERTDRLRAQAALIDAARDAIYVRGLDHRISFWNNGSQDLYGWTPAEIVGQSSRDVLYATPEGFDAGSAEVMRVGHWAGELEQVTKDGRVIIADCRWQLELDDDGQPSFILCVNSDITQYKRDEERKNRAQRMESLGTLAGGIAHDLNNVLTPILMSSQLLAADESDSGRLELLGSIETGVKRGADMISQVLSFARGQEGHRSEIRIRSVLEQVNEFCRKTLPSSVRVSTITQDGLWPITGDPTQIFQVLVNLVTNAQDSMQDNGDIVISARNFEGPAGDARLDVDYVIIEVEDSGAGMDGDTASKVFEPFFTTKDTGKGTGLGLSTSLAIARSHGGDMELYSEPGRGTRFQLRLPAARASAAPPTAPLRIPRDSPQGDGEYVLVVDDEATIRQIVCQALEANGYRTMTASNGVEAIDVIENGAINIDIMFTDMTMPVMDGATTAAYLLEHHPQIAVIAASGLNANGGVARAAHNGVTHFLSKPFTTDELLRAVRDALDTWERS